MNNADSTWIDVMVQGLRLLAYLSLLVSAMIGLFGSLSILADPQRPLWYRLRKKLVYWGLGIITFEGVISLWNIGIHQGWSAAFIPFTTNAGRLSNGFALIAFYVTLAYTVPALIAHRRNGYKVPSGFLSAMLFPALGLMLMSGLLTRNYEGTLSLLLIYVFTGVCLVWLIVLRWLGSESEEKRRERQRFRWQSPDIKLTRDDTENHDSPDEEPHTFTR